jgi:heavy metal sensor kinase
MFSNKPQTNRTVTVKLTLWYSLICIAFCSAVFTLVSVRIKANTEKWMDNVLGDELREFAGIYDKQGMQGLIDEFQRETAASGTDEVFCRLLSPENNVLLSSDISNWTGIGHELAKVPLPDGSQPVFATLYTENSPFNTRMAAVRIGDIGVLQLGINLRRENKSYTHTQRILIAGSIGMILLSTLSGLLVARRAMSGVRRVTRTVACIRKDNLYQRVPAGCEGREINELADAFNQMLSRIEALVRELKEVSDNVAHDLRSPITRMRGVAETTLTGPQSLEAYRDMGATIIEESDRLSEMINTMLEIAQSESGVLNIERQELDMTDLLQAAADLFLVVAEEKQIELTTELPNGPIWVCGDKTRLQRTIANLLDNAIKYTPAGGQIGLKARTTGDRLNIEICDTGPGIPTAERSRIFERFYRGEKSRSSRGNGLGLSLAKTIVQAHGGRITVSDNQEQGSVFTVTLPTG